MGTEFLLLCSLVIANTNVFRLQTLTFSSVTLQVKRTNCNFRVWCELFSLAGSKIGDRHLLLGSQLVSAQATEATAAVTATLLLFRTFFFFFLLINLTTQVIIFHIKGGLAPSPAGPLPPTDQSRAISAFLAPADS